MTIKNDPAREATTSADADEDEDEDEDEYSSNLKAASPDKQEIQAGLAEAALVLVQTMQAKWDRGERNAPVESEHRGPWATLLCVLVHESNATLFEHVVVQGGDVIEDDAHRVKGPAGRVALLIGDVEKLLALEAQGDARDVEDLRRALASGDYAATFVATKTVACVRLVAARPAEPVPPAPNRLHASVERYILARWARRGVA
jgi:hypothetical protein